MINYSSRLITVISLLSLTACASFYDVKPDTLPPVYAKPAAIDANFDISGRFFIKQLNKNSYGNFVWHKLNESEELNINTPLGQTVAQIKVESGIATLATGDNTYSGDNLEQMMQTRLGFILPVSYLHYWIQGVRLPNVAVTKQLSDGFMQLGWEVEYLQWQDGNHPKIIQCSKDDLLIKLFIEW